MTLDLKVYCKDKPIAKDLALMLGVDKIYDNEYSNSKNFAWEHEKGKHICIGIKNSASQYSREVEPEEMEKIRTFIAEMGYPLPYGIVENKNTIKSNKELYQFILSNPDIQNVVDDLNAHFAIIKFSGGLPVYDTNLETFIGAGPDELDKMANLAFYIADKYDGIFYEPQTNSLEKPDSKKITDSSSKFFGDVMSLLKADNGRALDNLF